jgi:hypothetical protein
MTLLGVFDIHTGGGRIEFLVFQICVKMMSVKGAVCADEAYEARKIQIFCLLCIYIGPTSFSHMKILLVGGRVSGPHAHARSYLWSCVASADTQIALEDLAKRVGFFGFVERAL